MEYEGRSLPMKTDLLNLYNTIQNQIYIFPLFTRIFFLLLLPILFSGKQGFSQDVVYRINISHNPQNNVLELNPGNRSDSSMVVRLIQSEINELRANGYLLANLDSIKVSGDTLVFDVYMGNKYNVASLSINNLPSEIENRLKNKPKKYLKSSFKNEEIDELLAEIIRYSENHGYPFASIQIDSIKVSGESIFAELLFHPGPLIRFDSLILSGNLVVKNKFLGAYLDVIPGNPYDQRIMDNIPNRLANLPYLEASEKQYISFQNEECQVHLNLDKRKANKFDVVIGFLPNEIDQSKLLVTGKVDIGLENVFNSGKTLKLYWEKLHVSTQTLFLNYTHPNLFAGPVGLLAGIDLYKQDTSFINRSLLVGLEYLTSSNGKASIFSSWESSRRISQPTDQATLNDLSDFNLNNFGLRYNSEPTKGFSSTNPKQFAMDAMGMLGRKTVLKSANVNDSIYTGINLVSMQYALTLELKGQVQLVNGLFIYSRIGGGKMINENLFLNDLFRIGGLKNLRGFNENFFYASEYITGTLEARMYIGEYSNLFAFYDQGYVFYNLKQSDFEDTPFGVGIGMNIETKAGILGLVFALGKSKNQPLDFGFSKIHVGYAATF